MTYDQLEMLEMIIEKGSFKAASEALYKSQPSLSVAIKKLEEEFNIKLFNRDEYRPRLTEKGRVFYLRAKEALTSFRMLSTTAKELALGEAEPELTIVVDPLAGYEAIEGIFSECLGRSHPTELNFRSEILDGGMRMLLEGEADFAIAPKTQDHDEIESLFFNRVEMVPVIAKSAIETKDYLKDEEFLRNKPQIFVLQNSTTSEQRKEIKASLLHGQKCFVNDHHMKCKLIHEGYGWGRMAEHEIEDALKKSKLIRIDNSVVQSVVLDLHIMRLRTKPLGPVARAVWSKLQSNLSKPKSVRIKN